MTFFKELSQYWVLQALTIMIIAGYILGMSVGIIYFVNNSQTENDSVNILLIIESKHPDFTFNFTYSSIVPVNRTLIDHLNETVGPENWDGTKFGVGGWYIQRIYNASEQENWRWFIYYRVSGTKNWTLSPVGASTFKLNRDYEVKLLFSQ